ncbi:chaplin [Streptomyces sp. NPDC052301]|uniref:chaplin n=1 Tax=Streptomyces sp. NPDC052301 TaxID=3365687 RepID=UPI0037CCE5FB
MTGPVRRRWAGPAPTDAGALGGPVDSAGVVPGNVVQVPVDVPVNVCGNTSDVITLLNPAFGDRCANVGSLNNPGTPGTPGPGSGGYGSRTDQQDTAEDRSTGKSPGTASAGALPMRTYGPSGPRVRRDR